MKLNYALLIPTLAATFAVAAVAQASTKPAEEVPDSPQATGAALTVPNGPTVVMDTSMGRITCQFFQKQAPLAVANFIGLRSEEHTSELQSLRHLVCRLLLENKI